MTDETSNPEEGRPLQSGAESYGTPQYPDPAAPVAYPGATAPGAAVPPQYPGYTGPSPYPPTPITQNNGPGGLAITALVIGIVAFVLGWVPIFGLLAGIAGIVLGILALRQPRGKGFGIAALILSGIAVITGILMTLLLFAWLPVVAA